jgi:nicotinamide-nucleotide amidase
LQPLLLLLIVYSNLAKQEILRVKSKTLKKYETVSEQVAKEMAEGTFKKNNNKISIAITGIAGPTDGSKNKPIGTVCFAWAIFKSPTITTTIHFRGNRNSIREQAVKCALKNLLELLQN